MAVVGQTRPAPQNSLRTPNVRTPLFIFGVALALVAFLVMFAFGVVFVSRSQPSGSVPVVVAAKDIPQRTPITPDMLALSSVPVAAVPANTFLHISDLAKASAVVEIYKGQPISANLVTTNIDQTTSQDQFLPIPPGMVAVTIMTSELQGVAGFIAQGDYIDVVAIVNTEQFGQRPSKQVAKTVFRSVYVIRVGPQTTLTAQPGQKQGVSSSLTVVMSQCDANYMYWLLAQATVKYTLLSYQNYSQKPPADDGSCTDAIVQNTVGPKQVDARWQFTNG